MASSHCGSNARRREMPQAAQPSASRAAIAAITMAPVERVVVWVAAASTVRLMLDPAGGRGEEVIDGRERIAEHELGRLGGVDRADPPGLRAGQLVVGGGDRGEEVIA